MANIFGTSGNETISGSSSADTIYGGPTASPNGTGNDTINAGNGDDVVYGGDGTDTLNGENHNDTLIGGSGNDTLNGGSGTDTVDYGQDGGTGAVTVNMATGSATDSFGATDTLSSIENIIGTGLNDTIVANVSNFTNNSFNGGAGTDTVNYSATSSDLTVNLASGSASGLGIGTDTLVSIEVVRTGSGDDTLTAAAAGSTLIAGGGTDQLNGGSGNDTLVGGSGNDTLSGGSGTDTVDYSQDGGSGAVTVNLATGSATDSFGNTDTLSGIENVVGTGLNDTITANVTNGASNAFNGGSGTDTVTYAASTNALTVDLSAGTVTGTGVGTDTLSAIEIIRTGSGNDIFSAGAGGLGGVTTLDGGSGNDTLTTSAATLDLTGKTLTSIEQITTTNAAGTAFTTGSVATALLIHGAAGNDSVTLTGAAFTVAQRAQLFSQGVETVIDSSGTYTPNTAPTAVADTGAAAEDGGPVILTAASLLANDTDPDAGDTKTLVSVNGTGALGSVSINGDGNVVYDPGTAFQNLAAGVTATDTFTYTMQDSAGAQSTATVTITITGVNDDPTAGSVADQSTDEDAPLTVSKTLILAGAGDVDGDTVTLTGGSALHGTVSLDANGDLLYTPDANANGPDVVTYTLSDGNGGTTTGTFNVGVSAVNDDPVAGSVADQSTDEDTPLTVSKTLILAGAGDVDGDTVTLTGGSALHGTVSLNADGDLVYTPDANANGADVITYTLSDGHGGTTTGTINVGVDAVNDDPTAGTVADQSTNEDTPLTVAKTLILAGAGDVDGDTVTLTGGSALHGTVSLDANGDLLYTPDANANGPDVVTYTLSDGNGGTTTGSFNVGVDAVNDDPVAGTVADQSTDEDTPLTVSKTLILAGAGDIDGDTVTLTGGSALHGTVSLDANGDLVYTPDANANGADVVTYTLSDGQGGTTTGTFNVGVAAVNDDPVAGSVADQSTDEDTPLIISKAVILAGASDVDGDTITLIGGSALGGTVSLDANGDLVCTPDANINGTGVVTYTLSDGHGGTTTGTFNITVAAVNDDPLAGTVADQNTDEDTPLTVSKAVILAGASDVDGDTVTLTGGSALHGSVSLNADGDLVYTPDANANGPDVVTYTLSDGNGGTTTGSFNVGVAAVNDDPTAGSVADQSTDEDTPLTVSKTLILAGAGDVDGDTVTLTGGSALHGTVSLDANGDLVYTPDANANGADVITYTLSDGHGGTTTGTINVGVDAVNDDPTAGTVADQSTNEDTPLTVAKTLILAGAGDVDGDTVTLTGGSALHGTVSLNADGDLVYTPDANANGPDVVTYTLSDGHGGTTTGTFNVGVASIDDPGVAQADAFATDETLAITTGNVFADNGSGADGDLDSALTVTEVNGSAAAVGVMITLASGAHLTLNADGTFICDPNHAFDGLPGADSGATGLTGTDSFTYTLAGGDVATVTVTVSGIDSDDTLVGTAGDDTLKGGTGADHIDGLAGIDTASYAGSAAGVTVRLTTGTGSGGDAQGDTLTGIENLLGSSLADTLTGSAGANTLDGGDGNDILEGRAGADMLIGGAGIDTAYYTASAAGVTVDLGLGTGTGGDAQGDTLAGIEQVFGSAQADLLIGDAGANTLWGSSGDDTLRGGLGADVLKGGDGLDTADYTTSAAAVKITLITGIGVGGDAEGDKLLEIENLAGSSLDDTLTGSAGVNTLDGGAGNDILEGRAGADVLIGGAGIDTAYYSASAAGVTVDLALGTGTGGDAQGDTLSGIEQVFGSTQADTLIGNAGANTLWGSGGNDMLRGGLGEDVLKGGDGLDTASYAGSAAGVTVSLTSGLGAGGDAQGDKLFEIESLAGSGLADTLTGSAGANTLDGGAGNDILEGRAGADALIGGADIDTAYYTASTAGVTVDLALGTGTGGDAQGDTLTGIEQVFGSAQADTLIGDAAANAMWGNGGNDTLRGGTGADVLKGGAGNDSFSYVALSDSTVSTAGRDTISDFTTGDRIDLSGIDADGNAINGDTAFSFGTGGFTGQAGELRVVAFADGRQGVYLDANGDKSPESIIVVLADHALMASDFVL